MIIWSISQRWNRNAALEWGAGAHQSGAGAEMLHMSGRWKPPTCRWNRDAAQEWGARTHQRGAGTTMLPRSGALTHRFGAGAVMLRMSSIARILTPSGKDNWEME